MLFGDFPRKLIEFADKQKSLEELSFDAERDRMIVVFDADIFEAKVNDYNEVIQLGERQNILAVTNPSFELFLLLHFEGSYDTDIFLQEKEILTNDKIGNHRYIYNLLLARTHMNSKKNPRIGELAEKIDIAIEQEKKLNQDIRQCLGHLTCNIGKIINMIREDQRID